MLALPSEPPCEPLRSLPRAHVEGSLYVSVEARVDLPVSANEIASLVGGRVLVLHPAAGLVAFHEEKALRVSALLAPPPRSNRA